VKYFHSKCAVLRTFLPAFLTTVLALPYGNALGQPPPQSLRTEIEQQIISVMARNDLSPSLPRSAIIQEFYSDRGFQAVWIDESGVTAKGQALARVLKSASEEGLRSKDYAFKEISALLESRNPRSLGALEILLSQAAIDYAQDSQAGRVRPRDLGKGIFLEPQPNDPLRILSQAAMVPDVAAFLRAQGPQSPEYQRLKAAIARYRDIAQKGGWRHTPEDKPLKPGKTFKTVPDLRRRLTDSGDIAGAPTPQADPLLFDPALEAAVKRFQERHGLKADGVVGKMTRGALNVPAPDRVRQMLLNMERRRWMRDDLGESYVLVNMADFELKVVDRRKTIHVDHVVVGTPYNKTPVFSDKLSYLVFNPSWHIPPSIARKEMLPKIQKDIGYLAANNITVLNDWTEGATVVDPNTVDWKALSGRHFRYKLRQEAGSSNALGRIKFVFPNRHNIYLHDTPARALFSRTVRSFSHGCIRVEHPVELAKILLRSDPEWSPQAIETGIGSGKQRIVPLKTRLPIHLTYITAWVNKDGTVHFRDDIYDRDKLLASALGKDRLVMTSAE
jgi:L,D-transpeptidase YcbB